MFDRMPYATIILLLCLGGCTTEWVLEGSYYRATQTLLAVESSPPGRVLLNGIDKGESPVAVTLEYERETQRKTRKVSYWITQPALAMGITLLSLGFYLPFSVIPVDAESTQEPLLNFRSNKFVLQVQADGYSPWEDTVVCTGQDKLVMNPILVRRE